jgi:hypothetical protein
MPSFGELLVVLLVCLLLFGQLSSVKEVYWKCMRWLASKKKVDDCDSGGGCGSLRSILRKGFEIVDDSLKGLEESTKVEKGAAAGSKASKLSRRKPTRMGGSKLRTKD